MLDIKLQIGCTIVLLYIMVVYYRERIRYRLHLKPRIFDVLMAVGLVTLLLDETDGEATDTEGETR